MLLSGSGSLPERRGDNHVVLHTYSRERNGQDDSTLLWLPLFFIRRVPVLLGGASSLPERRGAHGCPWRQLLRGPL